MTIGPPAGRVQIHRRGGRVNGSLADAPLRKVRGPAVAAGALPVQLDDVLVGDDVLAAHLLAVELHARPPDARELQLLGPAAVDLARHLADRPAATQRERPAGCRARGPGPWSRRGLSRGGEASKGRSRRGRAPSPPTLRATRRGRGPARGRRPARRRGRRTARPCSRAGCAGSRDAERVGHGRVGVDLDPRRRRVEPRHEAHLLLLEPALHGRELVDARRVREVHDEDDRVGAVQRAAHPRLEVVLGHGREVDELQQHVLVEQHPRLRVPGRERVRPDGGVRAGEARVQARLPRVRRARRAPPARPPRGATTSSGPPRLRALLRSARARRSAP